MGGEEIIMLNDNAVNDAECNAVNDAASVLIASNSAFIRIMLATTLRKIGFDVIGFARKGEEVVLKCDELQPDVLILDAELDDGSDCISVARSISENGEAPAVILIFPVSSERNAEEAVRAVKAGVVGFLMKPITEGDIKTRISDLRDYLKAPRRVAERAESVAESK
ncbi:MAG: response regulator [Canidatus Methanoxibalbensis ujae]|nr:response regulator [Candidatus Methanoxibalbensis ujae]